MKSFLTPKLLKTLLSIAALVLVSQSYSSDETLVEAKSCVLPSVENCKWWQGDCRTDEEICTTDEDGNCWDPPRIISSNWDKCFVNKSQKGFNCPKYDALNQNHALYLLDTTNGTTNDFKESVNTILGYSENLDSAGNITSRTLDNSEVIANNAPYSRLTFVELTDTENVVGLEPDLSICRPRTGEENKHWKADNFHEEEGFVYVEDNYAKNFERLVFRTLEKVKKSPASDKSLIFEHIKQLSLPKYEFTSKDYKNRRLVILSDFLQNSKRFGKDSPSMKTVCTRSKRKNSKWTGACDSFLDFYNVQSKEDQNYLDKMKPDFDKSTVVEMHLLQTCGVKDAKISEELESLWTSYFVWAGVDEKNFELHEPRLVQDSGDENAPCN